jgi:uncharacterized protein (DUF433 family)
MMQTDNPTTNGSAKPTIPLTREIYGGEIYEYYPLGKYIVAAPGVCGGRPTFKYTRIDVRFILAQLAEGHTIAEIVENYGRKELTTEAISEAIRLASKAFVESIQSVEMNLA